MTPGRPALATRPRARTLLLVPAAIAMLFGLDAGLGLLDVWVPVRSGRVRDAHGVLMVFGFVGALVSLERAIALGRTWGYVAPVGLAFGALLHLTAPTARPGAGLLVVGAAALVAVYVPLWRRQRDDAVLVEAMGAVLGLGAAVLWLGGVDLADLLAWLAGFLVLTIVGERLELARLAMPAHAAPTLVALALGFCGAVGVSLLWPPVSSVLVGLTLAGLCGWLVAHDVARRTVRATGLTRFMGAAMLAAQAWLGVAAGVWLLGGVPDTQAAYDAVVHAVFLGFTLSMVMAHAAVILPAVTGIRIEYHPLLWAPMLLLQASLVLRLWAGDALGAQWAWQAGGVLNVVALVGFFMTVAATAASRRRS